MTHRIPFPRLAALAGLLIAGMSLARAEILINEAHVDPPGVVNSVEGDGNYEYVELISTTGGIEVTDGLWLLQVDVRGGRIGVVKEAWDLGGLATGANGLLLLGDGYETQDGGAWSGFRANPTAVGDPPGFGGDSLKDNDAFCLLLVRQFTGVEEVGNTPGTDIDHNDDGVPSVQTGVLPWAGGAGAGLAGVLDSVGFGDRAERPAKPPLTTANLTRQGYDPDNVSRRPGDFTPNSAAAWYGGVVAGTSLTGVTFSPTSHFGLNDGGGKAAPGEATPGFANHAVAPPAPVFRINEVSLNPPGPDGNAEYIELLSTNRSHASLDGLTLVLLDANNQPSRLPGTGTVGEIVEAWSLAGLATGANGLLLLGDAYSRGATPWGASVHPDTAVADPPGMGRGDIGDDNGFTLLLVRGFNGIPASDTSAGTDVDTNDDGLVDAPRWTEVVDDIGFNQVDILNPIAVGLGRTYAAARIMTVPAYEPDHLSRRLGAAEARAAEAWYGGDFGGDSPLAVGLRTDPARPVFGGFKGEATPGAPNLTTPRSSAGVLINEVNFNPVEAPDPTVQNEEFIELIHRDLGIAGLHGLTLLVVDTARPSVGEIKEAFDLSGLSTGPNGLLLLGDAYDLGTPYGAEVSVATNRENPSGFGVGDLKDEKAGLTLLIVRNLTAARGHDLDPDDDGTFNSTPWAEVLDGVGFGAVNDPAVVTLPVTGSIRTFARHHADLRRTAAAWHGGDFGSTGSMLAYGESRFGVTYRSAASPGRYNHTAEPVAQSPLLNELLVAAPRGTAENTEFIELINPSGRSVSTNGFSLLLVDSSAGSASTGNVGRILEAWSLDGLSTGANGLLLLGDGYGGGRQPWKDELAPAAATRLAEPAGLDAGDLGRSGDNGAFSLLLVKNFDGFVNDDLDITGGPGNAGDGILERTPWSALMDAVAVRKWNATPSVPPARLEGTSYGGADLSQSGYTPQAFARINGMWSPLSVSAWAGGSLGAGGVYSAQRFPSAFAGALTPGRPNPPELEEALADPDGDTVPAILENAFGMNPQVPDPDRMPTMGLISHEGGVHPFIRFSQLAGGSGVPGIGSVAGGFRYTLEGSSDMLGWAPVAAGDVVLLSTTDEPATGTQRVTLRLSPSTPARFLRLRVSQE